MNFVFFSTIHWDWSGGGHQPPRIAQQLAERGHRVLFVQAHSRRTPSNLNPRIKIVSLVDLGVPETLAARAWYGFDIGLQQRIADSLVSILSEHEQPGEARIASWFAPFDPFARLLRVLAARDYHTIYYPLDDFKALLNLGVYRVTLQAEEYLAKHSEMIVALSENVAEKMRHFHNQVHVIPDGVDLNEFRLRPDANSIPPNLLRGERTLGFWGHISNTTFDAEMIEYVARARPTWTLNLLGGFASYSSEPLAAERLKTFPNVRFHGFVPHRQLRDYGKEFDVGLIPYPNNEFSRSRSPIKLYEYLALYKPVVASHAPGIVDLPYTWVASSPREFLECVEAALRTTIDRQVIDRFIEQQTWSARAEALLDCVNEMVRSDASSSSPSSTKALIIQSFAQELQAEPRLRAYLESVEQELARTQQMLERSRQHIKELEHTTEELEHWATELNMTARAQQAQLARLNRFFPIGIVGRLRRFLANMLKR